MYQNPFGPTGPDQLLVDLSGCHWAEESPSWALPGFCPKNCAIWWNHCSLKPLSLGAGCYTWQMASKCFHTPVCWLTCIHLSAEITSSWKHTSTQGATILCCLSHPNELSCWLLFLAAMWALHRQATMMLSLSLISPPESSMSISPMHD
jgi:hypothetical protein